MAETVAGGIAILTLIFFFFLLLIMTSKLHIVGRRLEKIAKVLEDTRGVIHREEKESHTA